MYRRTVHRGIAALSIVTFLAVAGAQPAAAAPGAGALGQLTSLWTAVAGGEFDTLWNRLTGWMGNKPVKTPRSTTKRGWGIDPNGRVTTVDAPTGDGSSAPGETGSGNNS